MRSTGEAHTTSAYLTIDPAEKIRAVDLVQIIRDSYVHRRSHLIYQNK